MLAARGVSLGLGKINLSDLHQLPSEKHRASQLKREDKARVPKIVIKKKADAKDHYAPKWPTYFTIDVLAMGLWVSTARLRRRKSMSPTNS
ncbi:hypothetical protein ANCDUO_26398 [Ancylostoma duodenale]|uniref:Uncharacterized protein n=1 Tax=Ancylostoma duodenale TaxID=51022 RepID=A0A0C2C1X6_9BILA|nr:hypothetical protein ANCDUO_26398 [Ancylostoma duodenale]